MALQIHSHGNSMKMHMLAERTYTTLDGKSLAKPGDQVKMLLGAKGAQILEEKAIQLGLVGAGVPEDKAVEKSSSTEDKAVEKASTKKAGKPRGK